MSDYEEMFNLSYWRTTEARVDGVPFLDAFLNNLVASSPEVEEKVAGHDLSDFRAGLPLAILHLASYSVRDAPSAILEGIAERQNRTGRNIEPHLYDLFLEALLETVKSYDPDYGDDVGHAWATILTPGLEYMKRKY